MNKTRTVHYFPWKLPRDLPFKHNRLAINKHIGNALRILMGLLPRSFVQNRPGIEDNNVGFYTLRYNTPVPDSGHRRNQ